MLNHSSNSPAILAGDLLIAGAYELIIKSKVDYSLLGKIIKIINTSIFEVAGGELMDTEASFMPDHYDPLTIYRYKTASYSTTIPLLLGATTAGASSDDLDNIKKCGESLGIAYQIRDDNIGLFGKDSVTGKSNTSDIVEGKRTLLIEEYRKIMPQNDKSIFTKAFGNRSAKDKEIAALRRSIQKSNALSVVNQIEASYLDKAFESIEKIKSATLRLKLLEFMETIKARQS